MEIVNIPVNKEWIKEQAKTCEGKIEKGDKIIIYKVTPGVECALTGNIEGLKNLIDKGLSPLGLDYNILNARSKKMELNIVKEGKSKGAYSDVQFPINILGTETLSRYDYFTTMEAAIIGDEFEMTQFLLEEDVHINLRNRRTYEAFLLCENEDIIEYTLENKECNPGILRYKDIIEKDNINGQIVKALYERGCKPNANILDEIAEKAHKRNFFAFTDNTDEEVISKVMETKVWKYLESKGYQFKGTYKAQFDFFN